MRNNGAKYVMVIALLVAVVALSLGFAAFTRTLTIQSSAEVSAGDFNVCLSKSATTCTGGAVTPTLSPASGTPMPTGSSATIDTTTKTTISGLKATFTGVGQSVTYSMKAYNDSAFLAYLNGVTIGSKTCTAAAGTNQTYVNSACNGISLSVKVGSDTYNATNTSISNKTLAAGSAQDVVVTISYASNAAVADGDFTVAFGDTVLLYGTAD